MDIQSATRRYVLEDADIAAALGQRFYPIKLPQNVVYPAMTMQRISGVRFGDLRGPAGLARPRYQFDIWARELEGEANALEVSRLGRLLLARLEGKTTRLEDDSVSPVEQRIVGFEFIDDEESFEPGVNGGYFRYTSDFYIWHQTGR
jgi:hypothetical protein